MMSWEPILMTTGFHCSRLFCNTNVVFVLCVVNLCAHKVCNIYGISLFASTRVQLMTLKTIKLDLFITFQPFKPQYPHTNSPN